jgi:hypothetical protein
MKTRRLAGFLCVLGLFTAGPAAAQFVTLSRCQAALPCAIPFGVRYRPDPLITAQYGRVGSTAVSAGVRLETPLKPEIDKRTEMDLDAVDAAVRKSLQTHPPPAPATSPKKPRQERPAAEPPGPEPRP